MYLLVYFKSSTQGHIKYIYFFSIEAVWYRISPSFYIAAKSLLRMLIKTNIEYKVQRVILSELYIIQIQYNNKTQPTTKTVYYTIYPWPGSVHIPNIIRNNWLDGTNHRGPGLNRFHRGQTAYILTRDVTTNVAKPLPVLFQAWKKITHSNNLCCHSLAYWFIFPTKHNLNTYRVVRNINQSDDSSILLEFYRWLCHSKTLMAYFRAKFQVCRGTLTSRVKQLWKIMSRRKDKSIC